MEVLNFMNTHDDWEEILTQPPYCIKVNRDGAYILLKYNQLSSDFALPIVRECRGSIFYLNDNGKYECVCRAFDKFGNYGESYVPDMDWSTVKCTEKIDGSIMKLWCYNNCWHLSTNGNINAKEAKIGDVRKDDFDQVFCEACIPHLVKHYGTAPNFTKWFDELNPEYTYIFELVSPYNRVVIPYEHSDIYFLGARNNITNQQFGCDTASATMMHCEMFPKPWLYATRTLEDILKAANDLPWNEEGYVCYDKNFNRCKIKSPKYVMAHFARNNNVITRWHLIDVILKGEMDEFIIYASDYKDQIEWIKKLMDEFIVFVDDCALMSRNLRKLDRPEAAEVIKKFHKFVQPIMFMNLKRIAGGRAYTYDWDTYKWERALDNFIDFLERGPENDL